MNSAEKREQEEKKGRLNNILDDPNLSPEEKLKVKHFSLQFFHYFISHY